MKEYHQTPLKEQHSRSSDHPNRRLKEMKKPQKITKKSLDAAFTSVSENAASPTTKESLESSPVSEVSDGVQFAGSFKASLDPALSASAETFALSDLTPSSNISADKDEGAEISSDRNGLGESDGLKMRTLEADVIADHLRQARFQVMSSVDMDLRNQKLLDALIKIVIEEFYSFPEEKSRFSELISVKSFFACLCFLLWILGISALFFLTSDGQSTFGEPLPT